MSPLMKLTPHLLAPTGVPVLLLGLAASTGTVTLTATAAGTVDSAATACRLARLSGRAR
jgi:hypothetical protein